VTVWHCGRSAWCQNTLARPRFSFITVVRAFARHERLRNARARRTEYVYLTFRLILVPENAADKIMRAREFRIRH